MYIHMYAYIHTNAEHLLNSIIFTVCDACIGLSLCVCEYERVCWRIYQLSHTRKTSALISCACGSVIIFSNIKQGSGRRSADILRVWLSVLILQQCEYVLELFTCIYACTQAMSDICMHAPMHFLFSI
jgi:hypothetical protein